MSEMNCNNLQSRVSLLENYQSRGSIYTYKDVSKLPEIPDFRYKNAVHVVDSNAYLFVGSNLGDTGEHNQWRNLGKLGFEEIQVNIEKLLAENIFKGTDGTSEGKTGSVPPPNVEDVNKFLKSDGSWSEIEKYKYHKIDLLKNSVDIINITNGAFRGLVRLTDIDKEKNMPIIVFYKTIDNETYAKINIPFKIRDVAEENEKLLEWRLPVMPDEGDIYIVYLSTM